MSKKTKLVTIGVHPSFFKGTFEPSRKKIEKQLGTKVSQGDFTKMLQESKVKLEVKFRGGKNVLGKKQKR